MKAKLLEIFDINYKMSALTRYSQTHLVKEESVLEHTGFVCSMAYYIGMVLVKENVPLNIGVLLSKAVVHDMDEIITGDIPRPTKYYNEGVRGALQEIEDANMLKISAEVELESIFYDWKKAKDGKEGLIVAICDSLAVVYKVYYEVIMFGNMTIADHADGIYPHIMKNIREFESMAGSSQFLHSLAEDARIMCLAIQKTGEQK